MFWRFGNAEERPEHKTMVVQKEANINYAASFIMHPFGNHQAINLGVWGRAPFVLSKNEKKLILNLKNNFAFTLRISKKG